MQPVCSEQEEDDSLDGVPLFEWETLRILWPDGTLEEREIRIREAHTKGGGTRYRAFVEETLYGVAVEVPLQGVRAERVHPPKFRVGDVVHTTDTSNRLAGNTLRVTHIEWDDPWRVVADPLFNKYGYSVGHFSEEELREGPDPREPTPFAIVIEDGAVTYRQL